MALTDIFKGSSKAQMMTLTALLIFLLMFAELFTFVVINIQFNRISENSQPLQYAVNFVPALRSGTIQFSTVSLQTAASAMAYYLSNSSLDGGNTISSVNLTNDVKFLVTNGIMPGYSAGSHAGNFFSRAMNGLTIKQYNSSIVLNFTNAGLVGANDTALSVSEPNNFTLSLSYIENFRINQSTGPSTYSLPINTSISLNSTPDLLSCCNLATYYVPIVLSNKQSSPTGPNFQQMITVNSLAYAANINGGWGNVEFTTGPDGTGRLLQAWIEANPSNTVSNTIVWINIPSGIAAQLNTTIYMDMMSANVFSANGPTGEAPELSSTYGKYDNGPSVF